MFWFFVHLFALFCLALFGFVFLFFSFVYFGAKYKISEIS